MMSIFEKKKKTKKKSDKGIKSFMKEQYALLIGVNSSNFKNVDDFFDADPMGTLSLKKLPSNKELKKNLAYFRTKVDYRNIHKQFRPLVVSMVLNNLADMVKHGDVKLKKSNLSYIEASLFGFAPSCDAYYTPAVWELHSCLYKLGTGRVRSNEILQKYLTEVEGNIENPGIVLNSIMMMAYQLTTTKKYKGVFLKHLNKFNDKDIAKAIRKLGVETKGTLKRHGVIDPMAKAFLDLKLVMPDKGMSPNEKFGFKIFMYGLYMLRSKKIEKVVFRYL